MGQDYRRDAHAARAVPTACTRAASALVGCQGAPPLDEHAAFHRDQLGGSARQGKDRGRVGIARRYRSGVVRPEGGEVSVLSDLERADARIESERASASDRGELEGVVGAERIVPARGGAVDQDREPSLVENIHPVVAGDRVRSDTDPDSGLDQWEQRSNAVPELGVRCRAVRDRAAMAGHGGNVFRIDAHAVDQEWPALQCPALLEERDCGSRARRDGDATALPALREISGATRDEVDFGLALGDVHCERKLARVGKTRRGIVERIGDRVRRVRGDAERDQLRLVALQRLDAICQLSHCDLRLRWIGAEHFLVHDAAHAGVAHRLHHDAAGAGVGKRRDAGLDALDDAEASGIEQRFRVHDLVPALAQLVDPRRELTILEKTAHRGQLEVRMCVDETGKQDGFAEIVVFTCRRTGARPNVGDQSAALDDGSILYRRLGDGEHPTRVIAHQRGGRPAGIRSVRRLAESRLRLSARRRLSRRRT